MNKLQALPLALVLFSALSVFPATGQATEIKYDHRVAGDRSVTISLGGVIPQAFQSFSGGWAPTNLSLGGTLGIDLDFYLNDNFRLGGGLKGKATVSPNAATLFMVPITFRATYEFKWYPFSFPVGAGAGFCFTSLRTSSTFDPVLMPTAGAFWNMNSTWSFGLNASEWIVIQPYWTGGSVPSSDSRVGYFADITLGAIYHF